MDNLTFFLELAVILACIVMGTRVGGAGVGLWGGVGVGVLVFVFGEQPGAPPAAAVAIILAVVTAAALMQASGGIDWMVKVAAGIIEAHPTRITYVAPLTAFAFSVGAGTSNILYPLMPVIYDVSYRNGIRPSRPMSVSVVQSGVALAASPVSAAMAAMLTLTDVAPFNLGLAQILAITLPACIVGIFVTSFVVSRLGPDLEDDPAVQEKISAGLLPPVGAASSSVLIRTRGDADALLLSVRAAMSRNDVPLLLTRLETMEGIVHSSLLVTRTISRALLSMGALALLLAAVGLYGVVSYVMSGRTREFGVRLALGATPSSITRMVLGYGMRMTLIGGIIGLVLGFSAIRLIGSMIFGSASYVTSGLAFAAVLSVVTLVACALPALRATAVGPASALRPE